MYLKLLQPTLRLLSEGRVRYNSSNNNFRIVILTRCAKFKWTAGSIATKQGAHPYFKTENNYLSASYSSDHG